MRKMKLGTEIKKRLYEFVNKNPYGTEEMLEIKSIIVPYVFKKSPPKQFKIDKASKLYEKKGFIDKPITVEKVKHKSKKDCYVYILRDGYTRFLVASSNNQTVLPVQYI